MSNTINTNNTANILQQQADKVGANAPAPHQNKAPQKAARNTFADFMRTDEVKNMVSKLLSDERKREQFMSSVISLQGEDSNLQDATRGSILKACLRAATLDLPIDKNLGFAWVIAYKTKVKDGDTTREVKLAQCQLGYKAFIQFALRTGKYHKINAIPIYKGQLKGYNYLTEEYELDFSVEPSSDIIGYMGYFKLLDGFEKTVYWSKADIEAHRQKFSKQAYGFGWKENFDAMALKTVVKGMLNKWGLLTTQLQNDLKEAEESERIDITDEAFETEPNLQLN
ncbi:recombinase RecT [Priestia sp. SB1]|uniref:recombinase RecT n=1 Tax=Priestia sp. SB1 TaxID=3132359 RepID=UPI003180CDF8